MTRLPGESLRDKLLLNHRIEAECWRWTGAHTPAGYGQVSRHGKVLSVHRVSYETFVGPIAEGLDIDHLCRVRDCINPAHLEPVSHRENLLRSPAIRRLLAKKAACKYGHAFTPENTYTYPDGARKCRTCRARKGRPHVA